MSTAAFVGVVGFLASPVSAHRTPFFWSEAKLQRILVGARIRAEGRSVAIDPATLACLGEGRGWVRRGVRLYRHFDCVQPTFPPRALAGPDLHFRVHVAGRTKYIASGAHFAR
jgi:hypothetical protein